MPHNTHKQRKVWFPLDLSQMLNLCGHKSGKSTRKSPRTSWRNRGDLRNVPMQRHPCIRGESGWSYENPLVSLTYIGQLFLFFLFFARQNKQWLLLREQNRFFSHAFLEIFLLSQTVNAMFQNSLFLKKMSSYCCSVLLVGKVFSKKRATEAFFFIMCECVLEVNLKINPSSQ